MSVQNSSMWLAIVDYVHSFEILYYKRILKISWKDKIMNMEVKQDPGERHV